MNLYKIIITVYHLPLSNDLAEILLYNNNHTYYKFKHTYDIVSNTTKIVHYIIIIYNISKKHIFYIINIITSIYT